MRSETPPRRRRKRGARLALAYALRGLIALTLLAVAALMVCGVLYLAEHLSPEEPETLKDAIAPGDTNTQQDPVSPPPDDANVPDDNSDETPERIDAVVVLDPGHGGVQPGCEFEGVLEKDIALSVARLTAEALRERGAQVILTREGDEDVSLEDRCRIANEAGADVFVSIHCNSYTEDTSVRGLEGYYHGDPEGQALAEAILYAADSLSITTRHVRDENYQVLRDTEMPSALIEVGFMSCPGELELLKSEEYQRTLARAIADGIAAHF